MTYLSKEQIVKICRIFYFIIKNQSTLQKLMSGDIQSFFINISNTHETLSNVNTSHQLIFPRF